MEDIKTAFTRARSSLLLKQPFFGTLCLRLGAEFTEDIETAATNGEKLLINPTFFLKQSAEQRVGLLAHEVMHCVYMHVLRLNERDPFLWNVAGDYVINLVVTDAGMILPEGGLLDEKYRDMTADEIYTTLQQNGGAEALSGANLSAFDGTCVQPNPGLTDTGSQSKHEADMRVAVQQAAETAKAQGKLPGSLSKLVDDIVSPQVNWKQKLARFLKSNNKSDYSWQKPNRRFVANGLYLPSLYSPCIEEIGVIVDTSGSRTDEELNQDLGEISSMLVDANVENVRFMQADTDVTDEQTFTRESMPLKVTMKGRGGTRFGPAVAEMAEKYPSVSCLIYLTDLESNDFGEQPHFPVVWITNSATDAPYGEVIEVN